jgi:hypothetical protein
MSITQPSMPPAAPAAGTAAGTVRRQPDVGAVGALVAITICALLGIAISPLHSVQILGPVTTFSLPVLIASALWWKGGPIRTSSRVAGGVINTAVIVGGALVLVALAQLITGRADLGNLLSTTPAATAGHAAGRPPYPSYPWTLPLAGLIFLSMIVLTFVCDRWPLARLGNPGAGIAAIVVSWIIGLLAYELLANWTPIIPAPGQAALGLHNPGGPVNAFNLLGWTLSVAVWAVVLFIPLHGRPLRRIAAQPVKAGVGTVAVVALGWGTFLLLNGPIGLTVPEICAGCGALIAGSLIATLVFETWPSRLLQGWAARDGGLLATIAVIAAVAFIVLKAIGDNTVWPPQNPVYLWMTVCELNFLAAGSILWYGVWRRWPVAQPTPPAPPVGGGAH